MVKPLIFKGDKKPKKRKRPETSDTNDSSSAVQTSQSGDSDDSWTSPTNPAQIAGPVIFVLPTIPPTCLASDAHGNVFASPLENMVDDDPKTSEPHDVRQVWVTSRVAGMNEGEFSFKATHGGYLSCDTYGVLGARREARGKEEAFTVETTTDEDGKQSWYLRTAATKDSAKVDERKYICAQTENEEQKKKITDEDDASSRNKKVSISLRGDGEFVASDSSLLIRMQARFLPQTEANKEAARVKEKTSRKELESAAGRNLTDEEVKRLKRAKREGLYHEEILDIRAKGKHDKFA